MRCEGRERKMKGMSMLAIRVESVGRGFTNICYVRL